jgi:hypothetical protein
MKRYVLTPSAKRDVNDIWDYIANDNSSRLGLDTLGRLCASARTAFLRS